MEHAIVAMQGKTPTRRMQNGVCYLNPYTTFSNRLICTRILMQYGYDAQA
ncbi:hypothetical protein APHNP_0333 [Anaplasma phagocytophilum str. ApNP]|uniref:Uncharacterized protein n=1 Tax=Anaplasma phagocytophilum str. ApNP TaxID=1359153 RepID=A0A0F3NHT7_ANAPH|nr:hypothetical protein APHNP_0333 [Anaplasma phagocytophilum str. ApNP]